MPFSTISSWFRHLSRAQIDGMIFLISTPVAFAILAAIDAYEMFDEFRHHYEAYNVDEIAILLVMLGLASLVYSARRLNDLKQEIRRRETAENRANSLSSHDDLTGLPNRRHFVEITAQDVCDIAPERECVFYVVNLDLFKPINVIYGHQVGDLVLQEAARRLTHTVKDFGTVARIGGDEFAIMVTCVPDLGMAERIGRRLVYDISRPFETGNHSITIGVSIGIALAMPELLSYIKYKEPAKSTEFITRHLRRADMAMHQAKTEGRGHYRFFEKQLDDNLKQKLELESELADAISNREIIPYFQPLMNLSTNELCGFEILARWNHPAQGILAPNMFIPMAEDTGLIRKLTISLLIQALEHAKAWPENLRLSLNLSPRMLNDEWVAEEILGILMKFGVPPHRLEIEITESGVVEKIDKVRGMLKALRNVGVRVALDDFGTGYSGLSHLRELSIDTVKVDRSFVTDMLSNLEDAKIVEAVINLGQAMELTVTAEGIETADVMSRLTELGCTLGQGYHFGKPACADDITKLLKKNPQSDRKIA